MWRWVNSRGILGNLENRRVQKYLQANKALGLPPIQCFSWREWLKQPAPLPVQHLRIESPGEDAEVTALLIKAGGGPDRAILQPGEIAFLDQYYRGLYRALSHLQQACQNAPADILAMGDKWASHQLFIQAGLPRPFSCLAHLQLLEAEQGRWFFKPLYASSASGVCALRWQGRQRQLLAPIEIVNGKLFNSRKLRTYRRECEIEYILKTLLPQGMIAEEWIPKLSLPGGATDLRVLVIGGRARHRVVRQSYSPITNLHLGNKRGSEQALGSWLEPALRLAEQAAACFSQSLYVAVDILLNCKGQPWIGEVNAFGDLLPGVNHEGECTYSAIIKRESGLI